MSRVKPRIAIVLFNLGGPDGPKAVRPFLENLFSDPAIIGAPWLVRRPLAALIARLRERSAIANYALMGGGSPIVPETESQATALQSALALRLDEAEVQTFIAMRYWKPTSEDAARRVAAFNPDHIVLTPLYPQYSTTTTTSSLKDWGRAARAAGLDRWTSTLAPGNRLVCWLPHTDVAARSSLRPGWKWMSCSLR